MNFRILCIFSLLVFPLVAQGAAHDPAWSAGDSPWLAYYANPKGNFDIYVRMPDGKTVHPVSDPAYDGSPQWRPHHEQWSFMSNREGSRQLYLLNTADGSIEKLTDEEGDITNHAWSSDGRYVAYEKRLEGNSDIWLLDTELGDARQLTKNLAADFDPDFSPDNRRLVFQSNRGGSYQLYVMELETLAVSALPTVEGHATGPFWAGDGLVYFSQVNEGGSTLVSLDPESGKRRSIAEFELPTLKAAVHPANDRVALFQMNPANGESEILIVALPDGEIIERFE